MDMALSHVKTRRRNIRGEGAGRDEREERGVAFKSAKGKGTGSQNG